MSLGQADERKRRCKRERQGDNRAATAPRRQGRRAAPGKLDTIADEKTVTLGIGPSPGRYECSFPLC